MSRAPKSRAPKTTANDADVAAFLAAVPHPGRRADAQQLCELMEQVTGERPQMWGAALVGFGSREYRSASATSSTLWPIVGFAPRSANTTVYLMDGFDAYADLLARLGPHSTGKSCLYIKRLADVDLATLRSMIGASYQLGSQSRIADAEPGRTVL